MCFAWGGGGVGVEQNNKSLPPWNVESSETISGPSRHNVTIRAVGVLHSPVNMLQEDWTGFRNICKVFTGGWARGPASKQEQPLTSEAAHVQHPPAVHVRIQSKQFWSTIVCDRTGGSARWRDPNNYRVLLPSKQCQSLKWNRNSTQLTTDVLKL